MANQIENGAGTRHPQQIDSGNRGRIKGTVDTGLVDAVAAGRLFAIATSVVSLTTANHSHLLYIKNNGDEELQLAHVKLQFGTSD